MRLTLPEITPASNHRFGLHPKGIRKQAGNQITETADNGRIMNILVSHLFLFLKGFGYYSFSPFKNNNKLS